MLVKRSRLLHPLKLQRLNLERSLVFTPFKSIYLLVILL